MVCIYGLAGRLDPIKAQLSDVVHGAICATLGLPEDKRAHRFFPMARDDFYAPAGRSDAYTVIEISIMQGRSVQAKKALIKQLFEDLRSRLNISPVDVEITLFEQPPHCWGFRGMTGDEAKLGYNVNV